MIEFDNLVAEFRRVGSSRLVSHRGHLLLESSGVHKTGSTPLPRLSPATRSHFGRTNPARGCPRTGAPHKEGGSIPSASLRLRPFPRIGRACPCSLYS